MAATAAYPRMDRFVWHQRVTRTATLMVKSATWPQTRVLGRILLRNPVSPREDALGLRLPMEPCLVSASPVSRLEPQAVSLSRMFSTRKSHSWPKP